MVGESAHKGLVEARIDANPKNFADCEGETVLTEPTHPQDTAQHSEHDDHRDLADHQTNQGIASVGRQCPRAGMGETPSSTDYRSAIRRHNPLAKALVPFGFLR